MPVELRRDSNPPLWTPFSIRRPTMRTRSFLVLSALIAASALLAMPTHPALAALAAAAEPGHPAPPATPAAFDQLKALTGTWQARTADGKPAMKASYEVYGNGSAVVET